MTGDNMKKKTEFSKKLVTWAMVVTTASIVLSYILALLDHNPVTDVTVAVITTCVAIAVSYEAKSLGEKHSRNKYHVTLDADQNSSTEETPVG